MPFKSKAQMRAFAAKEARGELPKGTTAQWTKETPNIQSMLGALADARQGDGK